MSFQTPETVTSRSISEIKPANPAVAIRTLVGSVNLYIALGI